MYQKRNQKRNYKRKKRIEKRNQEEEEEEREEDWEEDEEEKEEEIWRGLSNIRYVSCCIIEDKSFIFYWLFIYCLQMDEGCRKEDAEDNNWQWEPEQEPSCEKDEYETKHTSTIVPV